jgi:RimJ/RimL family protein N-acetyltransferase
MIYLTPFTPADYDRLISWVHTAELLMQYSGPRFSFPLTDIQLDENGADPARRPYNVVDAQTDAVIGHCELYYKPDSILIGRILIGDTQARGKGIGGAIIRELVALGKQDPERRWIELNVFDWNHAAIRCYEREGFVLNPDVRYERQIGSETWVAVNMVLRDG